MRSPSVLLAAFVLALVVSSARGDVAFVTLDEEVFEGRVVKLEEGGVRFATEKAESVVRWDRIHPRDRYRLRASVTPPDDARARFALAKQCLADAFYRAARDELERALALGHPDDREIEKLMQQADDRECDGYAARLEEALDQRDFDEALKLIAEMAKRFPNNDQTAEARGRVGAIVRAKEQAARQEEEDAQAAAKAAVEAKRRKWLDDLFAKAEKWVEAAKGHMIEGRTYDEKGNRTRARKGYEGAEENLIAARRAMIRVRRATREGDDFDKADALVRSIERKLLDAYLGLGAMYVGDGNYKRGVIYVDRALLFDPVNPEALRLSEEIREKWIRRRLSSITNAFPR